MISLSQSYKCCSTGESSLRCSSTLVAKCWTLCPTYLELHSLHVSLYTTLDLSSRAKEVLRDVKHVFIFLVVKIIPPRIFAEYLQLTVEMDCLDIVLLTGVSLPNIYNFSVLSWVVSMLHCKKGMSLSTMDHFSALLPSPLNFLSLNDLVESLKHYPVQPIFRNLIFIPLFPFFLQYPVNFSRVEVLLKTLWTVPSKTFHLFCKSVQPLSFRMVLVSVGFSYHPHANFFPESTLTFESKKSKLSNSSMVRCKFGCSSLAASWKPQDCL